MYSRDRCRPATCRLWVADRAVDIIKVIIIIIIITRPMMRSQAALVTRRVLTVTPTSTRTPTATTIATAVRQSSLYRSLVMIMPAYLQCEFKITIRLELDAQLQLFSYSNNQSLSFAATAFCAAAPTVWLWNSLGVHTRSADTFLTFNNRLKTELFKSCYS